MFQMHSLLARGTANFAKLHSSSLRFSGVCRKAHARANVLAFSSTSLDNPKAALLVVGDEVLSGLHFLTNLQAYSSNTQICSSNCGRKDTLSIVDGPGYLLMQAALRMRTRRGWQSCFTGELLGQCSRTGGNQQPPESQRPNRFVCGPQKKCS